MFSNEAIGSKHAAPIAPPAGYFYPLGFRGDLAKSGHTARHLSDLPTWVNRSTIPTFAGFRVHIEGTEKGTIRPGGKIVQQFQCIVKITGGGDVRLTDLRDHSPMTENDRVQH
jgi:hypothetical protein